MKYLLLVLSLLTTQSLIAKVTCAELRDGEHQVKVIKEAKILTKENWKNFDVIADMNYKQCKDYMTQQLIEVNGERFWELKSNEDYCDGGNTYGVVYTEDLKTPIAHIYDYDMYCQEEGWHVSALAQTHKCDKKAEELAAEKMRDFDFDFEVKSSTLQLRKHYSYSFIFVDGILKNKGDKLATVRVLANLKNCKLTGSSISHISLK